MNGAGGQPEGAGVIECVRRSCMMAPCLTGLALMSPPPTPPQPLDVLREPLVLIWAVLGGIGVAAVLSLAPGQEGGRLVRFGLATLVIQWIILGTLASLYALQRPLSRLKARYILHVALGLLLILTVCVHLAVAALAPSEMRLVLLGWDGQLPRAVAIALIVGLLAIAALQNHLRAQALAVRAKHSELEALQARTHPHFLFNTLNAGAALIHTRPEAAERLLLDLADLFRAALSGPRLISLEQELDLTKRYLAIEQLRLGDRLRVHWQLPDNLPDVMVPALTLQPLAENAVRHGIEPRISGGCIDIRVAREGATLVLAVQNDLPDPDSTMTTSGHNVGIRSVSQRIDDMTLGQGAVATRVLDGRYVATIHLPISEARA